LNMDATIQVCHSKTKSLKKKTKNADIIISAAGINNLITHNIIKRGVVIIDAGYNNNKGDFNLSSKTINKASLYTPVPGGVGPMTIISLLEQALEATYQIYTLKK
ncbi:MAG: bifunctional 5,10-methylene-tetrahydrofolate dehydrogenase/5,10-methylene-tetrahydrofolate cyclohydrolase, partial [archaeon]